MQKFTLIQSAAIPWLMPNVDTDVITPMKRMLMNINELDKYVFEAYRFIGGNGDTGETDPAFPLNQPQYNNAQIMIVGENFGCGSSRETAPMAIAQLGIRCLIGTSFGGIFFKNCFHVGILPISLPEDTVNNMAEAALNADAFTVDLEHKQITTPDGKIIPFEVETVRRTSLLEGLDDVGMTLQKLDRINAFFTSDKITRPWLY